MGGMDAGMERLWKKESNTYRLMKGARESEIENKRGEVLSLTVKEETRGMLPLNVKNSSTVGGG